MTIVGAIWTQLVLAAAVFPMIYKLFDWVESNTSPQFKTTVRDWLQGTVLDPVRSVSNNITHVFQSLYGQRQFSRLCFVRVILLSALTMIISLTVLGGWAGLFVREETNCLLDKCWTNDVTGEAAKKLATFFVFLNIPIDYIAVGLTRALLSRVRGVRLGFAAGLKFLLLDVLTKAVLAIFGLVVLVAVEEVIDGGSFRLLIDLWYEAMNYSFRGTIVRASLLAMLLGSAWIWMYYFSLLATIAGRLRGILDIQEHPIRSIGLVTAAVSTGFYALVLLVLQIL
jgi:hypothetical protein